MGGAVARRPRSPRGRRCDRRRGRRIDRRFRSADALASRGYGYVEIEITTPGLAHASGYDPAAPHAVAVAANLIGALERDFRPSPAVHALYPAGPTVVAGYEIGGGEALGRLPERARFSVGVRLLPGGDRTTLMRELTAFVDARTGDASARITPVAVGPFADGNGA